MSHTPGPWSTELYDWEESECGVGQRRAVIRQPKGDVDIAYVPVDEDDGEMQDNERLIAAAPDLLDALIRMRDEFNSYADCPSKCDAVSMAFRAIEKAGGE